MSEDPRLQGPRLKCAHTECLVRLRIDATNRFCTEHAPAKQYRYCACGRRLHPNNQRVTCNACYVSSGQRAADNRERARKEYQADPDKFCRRQAVRRKAGLDDEKKRQRYLKEKERYHSDPEFYERRRLKSQKANRKKDTGVSHALYEALYLLQGARCAICTVGLPVDGSAHSDHFETLDGLKVQNKLRLLGAVKHPRGLLCRYCNVSLGCYEWNQREAGLRIEPYEKYLEKYPALELDV